MNRQHHHDQVERRLVGELQRGGGGGDPTDRQVGAAQRLGEAFALGALVAEDQRVALDRGTDRGLDDASPGKT